MKNVSFSFLLFLCLGITLVSCKKDEPETPKPADPIPAKPRNYATVSTFVGSTLGIAGYADGTGTTAAFNFIYQTVKDSQGNLFVADYNNHVIRKVTLGGVVTTFTGTQGQTGGTDATGTSARFHGPTGICIDASNNLYVAEYQGNRIRKITSAGVVTTFAGSTLGTVGTVDATGTDARFDAPYSIAIDAQGNLYISQPNSNTKVMRKITSAGVVTTWAGGATTVQDGTGTNAGFTQPLGVCIDKQGNVYVGDRNSVRKITSAGVVTTVVGSLTMGGTTEGIGANARFSTARGICTDNAGFLYVTDNNRIRKINLTTNEVTTLTGNIAGVGNNDGTLANATFNDILGLYIDSAGIIYASEQARILKIE